MIKENKKKIIISLSLAFLVLLPSFALIKQTKAAKTEVSLVQTQKQQVNIYFFNALACPVCAKEKKFLDKLNEERNDIKIHSFEISTNDDAAALMMAIGRDFELDVSYVPFTMIGNRYFPGFLNEETTGQDIIAAIECVKKGECIDILYYYMRGEKPPIQEEQENQEKNETETNEPEEKNNPSTEEEGQSAGITDHQQQIPEKLKVPFLGEIEVKNVSLPFLTIVVAALDGFNPCAMWVLVFLISLLLGMPDRKRMWILGSSFIIASAAVYFVFLAAWLNIFLFLGLMTWIRIIIGLVAIASAYWNLKKYFTQKTNVCEITSGEKQQKIFDKLRHTTQQKNFLLALLGIIALAVVVNLVELVCSAGLPAVFTHVLSLTAMPRWQYYLYLLLYILIFMLDDLIVFFVAMITLNAVGASGKYSRISKLIGGIIMLIIGILLIFKPEWLIFA